jgi:hypothetical protein
MFRNQLEQEIKGAIKVIEVDLKGAIVNWFYRYLGSRTFLENIHGRTILGLVASPRISSVESRQLRKRFDA